MKNRFYIPEIKRLAVSQWLPERGEQPEGMWRSKYLQATWRVRRTTTKMRVSTGEGRFQ